MQPATCTDTDFCGAANGCLCPDGTVCIGTGTLARCKAVVRWVRVPALPANSANSAAVHLVIAPTNPLLFSVRQGGTVAACEPDENCSGSTTCGCPALLPKCGTAGGLSRCQVGNLLFHR